MSELSNAAWSETAASNTAATPNGWPEGQQASTVNDCAREMMAALKRTWNRDHASANVTVGGTANAVTLTYAQAPASYVQGEKFAFKATSANTGAATVAVNALGALSIFRRSLTGAAVALVGGEWQAGDLVELEHDGTQFQILNLAPTRSAVMWGSAIAITAGTTSFIGPWGASSTEGNVQVAMPYGGTLRNLQVFAPVAPGVGQSFTATVRAGGGNTTLTAAISGASTAASDATHTATLPVGSVLDVKLVASAGAASSFIGVAFEITTP